jgi:flagellar biosynthesis component FlhA
MKLSGVLVAVCVTSCGLIATLVTPDAVAAAFMGMLAPLIVGVATIVMVERTTRNEPRALTSRMTIAFLAKMLFYAAYVSVVLALVTTTPIPFMVSFTVYFVALQFTEAVYFKTLFTRISTAAVN